MSCFSCARELFDAVRDASYELWRHDVKYNAMEQRAMSLGGCGTERTRGGTPGDRTRAVDAMVDYETMMQDKVDGWCRTVDYGEAVLYGHDWEHGIAKSLGLGYAEVLELVYVQRLSMKETAKRLKFSERTCQRMRSRALSHIDAIGIDAAMGDS